MNGERELMEKALEGYMGSVREWFEGVRAFMERWYPDPGRFSTYYLPPYLEEALRVDLEEDVRLNPTYLSSVRGNPQIGQRYRLLGWRVVDVWWSPHTDTLVEVQVREGRSTIHREPCLMSLDSKELASMLSYNPRWIRHLIEAIEAMRQRAERVMAEREKVGLPYGEHCHHLEELKPRLNALAERLEAYLGGMEPSPVLARYLALDLNPYSHTPRRLALGMWDGKAFFTLETLALYEEEKEEKQKGRYGRLFTDGEPKLCEDPKFYDPLRASALEGALQAFVDRATAFLDRAQGLLEALEASPNPRKELLGKLEGLRQRMEEGEKAYPAWNALVWHGEDFTLPLYTHKLLALQPRPRGGWTWVVKAGGEWWPTKDLESWGLPPKKEEDEELFRTLVELVAHLELVVEERAPLAQKPADPEDLLWLEGLKAGNLP